MEQLYRKVKTAFDKYERYLMPLTMALGFIIDNLTLRRIDLWMENLIIIIYLLIAIICILYLNTYTKKSLQHKFFVWLSLIVPFGMQYAFGALFSSFMVFYVRSSTLLVSWPFLLVLFGLLIGNEFFRQRYKRLYFHLSILYIAFFAYTVFALPVLVKNIGVIVFLGSGILSLILISLVIYLLYKIDNTLIEHNKKRLITSIAIIYLLFNILYFSNIIPPIPLAMRSGGVYHNVAKTDSGYSLSYEKPRFYALWRETAYRYNWQSGERVYIFNSIFAPTKFKEKIYHRWSYYDEEQGKWIEKSRINFTIYGGMDNGYRGYSYKTTIEPGKWKVDVITDTNQILGRIKFKVQPAEGSISLEKELIK
ncbi:MAG: DUF2914 domain-containing protein [bacterium]